MTLYKTPKLKPNNIKLKIINMKENRGTQDVMLLDKIF